MDCDNDINSKGLFFAISTACGMESVIQKCVKSISLVPVVNFFHEPCGKTACVTKMLIDLAPANFKA